MRVGRLVAVSTIFDRARECPTIIDSARHIDTEIGHAAPFVGDFYGRGVNDLLVGQFGQGILWIYRNVGTNANPRFAPGIKFKNGNPEGRVPTG